jgi:Domain of unknown function (DUF3786)
MTNAIDTCHFQDLAGKDPEDVCRRALCRHDSNKGCYTLSVWGEDYGIYPDESKIIRIRDDKSDIKIFLGLFIVHYLLTSKAIPISKEWISEKDIPGGVAFFRGPHAIPTHLIEKRYGDNIGAFCNTCEQLDGIPLDMADKAYSFRIAPRTPAAVLLWKGDDEFPAESKILFDKTIGEHLALDIILALTVEICTRVVDFIIPEAKKR